jgi:plastocyanin
MAARKEQMSRRKYARGGLAAAVAVVAAAIAVPALAATPPAKVTQPIVGGPAFVPNRLIGDSMHFKRDRVDIKNGGTITLADKTKAPHSFSLVKRTQVPRTARSVEGCEKGACGKLAVDHGAINPVTGEFQDPTAPLVNKGKAGFNQPGDSVLIPPGGKVKVKVTSGQSLYYICAFHPWMNGAINGRPVR